MSSEENEQNFVPKDLIPISLDKTTVYVYPKITTDMISAEKQYGLLVTKGSLGTANIPIKTKLQALGSLTDAQTIIGILQARLISHAMSFLQEPGNFTVVSYHGKNGKVIPDCTDSNGDLIAFNKKSAADRRPEGITFAKIACKIDFSSIDRNSTAKYPFTYFIKLDTETRSLVDDQNQTVEWNTWYGHGNWARSTNASVVSAVFKNSQAIDQPFVLMAPEIDDGAADVTIDIKSCVNTLESLALDAGWKIITSAVFRQICPNLEQDPIRVIQESRQSGTDVNGEPFTLSVEQYHKKYSRLLNFFPQIGDWPIDVTQGFISGLTQEIRDELNSSRSTFRYNPSTSARDAFTQISNLQQAYAAALSIEKNLNNVSLKIKSEMKSTHAFMTQVNASLADRAMKENGKKLESYCWGCGSKDHNFADRKGNVICPRGHEPEIKAKAATERAAFQERRKKKRNARGQSIRAQVLQILKEEASTSDNQGSSQKKVKFDHLCIMSLLVANNNLKQKELLPINYDLNLPHLPLEVGDPNVFTFNLKVAFDSLAVLNVGNADYHLSIAKRYPLAVKSLIWAKEEYTPLTLSGVVGKDNNKYKPTTELPAIIEYKLVSKTKSGSSASFKVALGKHVAVNTIIGFATIKAAKFTLDMDNEVVTSSVLDMKPVQVEFRPVQCTPSPDFSGFPASITTDLAPIHHIQVNDVVKCYTSAFTDEKEEESKPEDKQDQKPEPKKAAVVEADEKDIKKTTAGKYKRSLINIPKQKWRPKTPSDWNQEPKDQEDGFELVESCYGKGITLRRNIQEFKFPKPNPAFTYVYNDHVDKAELDKYLILDPSLDQDLKNRVREFVKTYWDTFREEGIKIPIQGYEMVIDTGNTKPVAVPLPHYGMYEGPVMQQTIDRLLDFGHIRLDNTSPWGFRITLAPKPHQEDVTDIEKYIWRFCINYIQLNRITRPSEYPIPRCDDAVMYGFGRATYFILLDAFSGYHQIRLSKASIDKTAFHAPFGRKYVWLVMPFGLRNAPAIFISMMHDLKALWTELCEKYKVPPTEDEGTTIIMDDCFLFALTVGNIFIIVECVCKIARKYHLTWKLKKCQWFPSEVEFVGVDISKEGNSPASSKFERLEQWKTPETPRDIMSFIGFAIFYLRWISFFEIKIKPLRELIKQHPIDHVFTEEEFTSDHKAIFEKIRKYILSKPILQRADITKRFYLKTDFSKVGLGWALCQPDNSKESLEAMKREDEGGECEFDLTLKGPRLLPIAMGGRKTVGNEEHFHSHPGESIAATFGIRKNRHFLWGRTFTLLTDCRALRWLMTYDGNNHAVRRLQLEMLGYWFTIVNRPQRMLEDANYFSRLAADIHIDPLLRDYLTIARQLYSKYKPEGGDLTPNNMPGRKKRKIVEISDETPSSHANLQFPTDEPIIETEGFTHPEDATLQNIPIVFNINLSTVTNNKSYNSEITQSAASLKNFQWCLYNPHFGHLIQTCHQSGIPFDFPLVIEPSKDCRSFLHNHFHLPIIKSTTTEAIEFLKSDTPFTKIQGYYGTLSRDLINNIESEALLFTRQTHLIQELFKRAKLQLFILELFDKFTDYDITSFRQAMSKGGWRIQLLTAPFEKFSDKINGSIQLIFGYHPGYFETSLDFTLHRPPNQPIDINDHIDSSINSEQYSIPFLNTLFDIYKGVAAEPRHPEVTAVIKPKNLESSSNVGYEVHSLDHPAPRPTTNQGGLFGELFGILFIDQVTKKQCFRSISHYEYTSMFLYDREYAWRISDSNNILSVLRHTTPFRTMHAILSLAYQHLETRQYEEIKYNQESTGVNFQPSVLLNGIIKCDLPSEYAWSIAYSQDDNCKIMKDMLDDPSLIKESELKKIHYIYRSPMRHSQIKWEENRLIYNEPITSSHKVARLIIIPKNLQHHIFAAFHSNPLGGHFGIYQTFHRIRLRYHWPNMYNIIRRWIEQCPSCLLKNTSHRSGTELLYSFPLDAPFLTVTGDIWTAGKIEGFEGTSALMIILCGLTGFAAIEPIVGQLSSKSFAKAAYRIMLRYGLPHIFISDPDSKFHGEFKGMCEILNIKHHIGSKGNHQAIIVERFNRFLNGALRIFNNDRDSNRVYLEGAELTCYAWNSAPVSGTDLSRSLLTVGREYHFPIDFQSRKHKTIDIDDHKVKSFADQMLPLLQKSQEIYTLLIKEHRALHREYRNSQLNNPRKFQLGDIVFTNVQVLSDKKKGRVGKLSYTKRGPYKISKCHPSGSYDITPVHGKSTTIIKKHGSDLILSPKHLHPVQPLHSSDRAFSELNKKMVEHPFEVIRIKEYNETQPWAAPAAFTDINQISVVSFPTVEELDDEYDSWPESINPFSPTIQQQLDTSLSGRNQSSSDQTTQLNRKATSTFNTTAHTSNIMNFSTLLINIIKSTDKLFFIAHSSNIRGDRREWKLVQLDLESSMNKRKSCMQDGIFLLKFYVQHPNDDHLHQADRRYWLEYHRRINQKTLSQNFHLIRPSATSHQTAHDRDLTPYIEWFNLKNNQYVLHGPFEFDTRNNRKTRDKISLADWNILSKYSSTYHNDPPNLKLSRQISVHWNFPIEYIKSTESITNQIQVFHYNLHDSGKTLDKYYETHD